MVQVGKSDLESRVGEIVRRRLEERGIEDLDPEDLRQEIVEEIEENPEMLEEDDRGYLDRRGFLKALGAGAGLTAFSSLASAGWGIFQPGSDGKSSIDADTVDGNHASDISGVTKAKNSNDTGRLDVSGGDLTVNNSAVTLT